MAWLYKAKPGSNMNKIDKSSSHKGRALSAEPIKEKIPALPRTERIAPRSNAHGALYMTHARKAEMISASARRLVCAKLAQMSGMRSRA